MRPVAFVAYENTEALDSVALDLSLGMLIVAETSLKRDRNWMDFNHDRVTETGQL